ncbi:MAG: hypothetical protein ABIA83_01705 [Patescibacteria group bacterium]
MSEQIKAWRKPCAITIEVDRTRSAEQDIWQMSLAIRQVLNVEDWHDLEQMFKACIEPFLPERHGPMPFGNANERFERRAQYVAEHFTTFGLLFEEGVFTAQPRQGVEIKFRSVFVGGHALNDDGHVIQVTIQSNNVDLMAVMLVKLILTTDQCRYSRVEPAYAPPLYIQASTERHSLFSQGSEERLGERLQVVDRPRHQGTIYRLTPLAGEELMVYGDCGASHDLGLHVPWSRNMPRHPDRMVFASVGPFSLALRKGERKPGRSLAFDRVVVFEDRALPLPKLEVVQDDLGAWQDDCDDSPAWEDEY